MSRPFVIPSDDVRLPTSIEEVQVKGFYVVLMAAALMGCSGKSVVQKLKNSSPPLPPYSGPLCMLSKPLPAGVESVLLGRVVANQQWYGGYAGVNEKLVNVARSVGADAVVEKQQKMKIGAVAWARPQVWGMAVRLKDPQKFDCVANGGSVYGGSSLAVTPSAKSSETYDTCMARVMRITDPQLRLSSMSACDSAK